MRIGIDVRMFENEQKSGIPIGVENDLKSWQRNHPENEYFLMARRPIYLDIDISDNWHLVTNPIKIDAILSSKSKLFSKPFAMIYAFFTLPLLIKKYKLDVFWGPAFFLPPKIKGTDQFVTIHDMTSHRFKFGDTYDRLLHKLLLPGTCRAATKIITVSKASARDICKYLKVSKKKLAVSYSSGPDKKDCEIIRKYDPSMKPELNIKGKYILFISTIEPRKNIITLINAFEMYMDEYHDDLTLVLAGGRGWKCEKIYKSAETSKYKDKIIMPGYISKKEKAFLLTNASVFAYPSLFEGFGIPVLEAYAYKIPLITTNISSLPEVGGDAAFYIDDPYDASTLAKRIREALTLSPEQKTLLDEKMERQFAHFSWDKNAEEILNLFEKTKSGK